MDLRIPVGALFTAIGLVLAVYGVLVRQSGLVQLGLNINLVWGLFMLLFGSVFLATGLRSSRRPRT